MVDHPPRPTRKGCAHCCLLFVALLAAALLGGVARADVVRILDDDREAAQARVDLIQQAQYEVDVASFQLNDDPFAYTLLALMRDAARRGVRVRLIIDGFNNHLPAPVQTYLRQEGVEIREYHTPRLTRPLELNRRMHDKLFIADGTQLIVGGRNLSGRNFGLADRNYVDLDAYVRGPAAAQAFSYFQCVWNSDDVQPVALSSRAWPLIADLGPATTSAGAVCNTNYAEAAINDAASQTIASGFLAINTGRDWSAGCPDIADVHFLCDFGGEKRHCGSTSEEILDCFRAAARSIIIESPYLVLSRALEETLLRARARGVCVTILTNSLASTDHVIVYGGYANQKRRLLDCGIELWEFAGPNHLHAKAAVIDDSVSIIGSCNFDPRSESLNSETAIIACDPILAACLTQSVGANLARAWQIAPDGTPVNSDCTHPGASTSKILKFGAARLVAPLTKRHL